MLEDYKYNTMENGSTSIPFPTLFWLTLAITSRYNRHKKINIYLIDVYTFYMLCIRLRQHHTIITARSGFFFSRWLCKMLKFTRCNVIYNFFFLGTDIYEWKVQECFAQSGSEQNGKDIHRNCKLPCYECHSESSCFTSNPK